MGTRSTGSQTIVGEESFRSQPGLGGGGEAELGGEMLHALADILGVPVSALHRVVAGEDWIGRLAWQLE